METTLFTSLQEAVAFINANKADGCQCPCCGSDVKIWCKKPISTAVASFVRLCHMYVKDKNYGYFHIDDFTVKAKDRNFSQLVLWGLIDPQMEDDDKRASGKWKPTKLGLRWYYERESVPKYVYTYNNCVVKKDYNTMITIREALGDKFTFEELIKNNFPLK